MQRHQLHCILAALVSFIIVTCILRVFSVTMYPDIFAGYVYVDEHGQKYTYVREPIENLDHTQDERGKIYRQQEQKEAA